MFKIKKDISLVWEECYPYFFAILSSIMYGLFKFNIKDDIGTILNAIISFSSIILGFIGVLLALMFSLNDNPIVKYIFENSHYKKLMKRYFKVSITSGFISIALTVLMFLRITIMNIDISFVNMKLIIYILKIGWVFFAVYFPLSSYRLISIILKIAFIQNQSDETINQDMDFDQEKDIKEMREELAFVRDEK